MFIPTQPHQRSRFLMENLYRWGKKQAVRDSENGFSLIGSVTSRIGGAFASFTQNVPDPERPVMAQSLVDAWFVACGMPDVNRPKSQWPEAWLEYRRSLPPDGAASPKRAQAIELWKQVEPRVTPLIGARVHHRGGMFVYSLPFGDYDITTEFEVGSRGSLLSYFQTVKEGRRSVLVNVNLFAWRGLLGSTDWTSLGGKSLPEVAGGIVRVVGSFPQALPEIVGG